MLDELWQDYVPELSREDDFYEFWEKTKRESRQQPFDAQFETISYPIPAIRTQRLSFNGFNGTGMKGIYVRPEKGEGKMPCLLILHGYGGSKGSVADYAKYLMMGFAVVALDTRGHGESANGSYPPGGTGYWVTQGILNPDTYYYRHVYMDVIRSLDIIESLPEIDSENIVIYGASMGGGIALAVAGLDDRPALVAADVPNMCDLPLTIQLKMEGSLVQVEHFLKQNPDQLKQVFKTLSYFDNKNLAQHISCPVRLSAGGKDPICPPQTIYGVYNLIKSNKDIVYYPFSGHDLPGTVCHVDYLLRMFSDFKRERMMER